MGARSLHRTGVWECWECGSAGEYGSGAIAVAESAGGENAGSVGVLGVWKWWECGSAGSSGVLGVREC